MKVREALSDRYRVERELGEGGMATVYLAHDLKHDRKVALKVLKPELAAVVGSERFLAEIRTTAKLQHPHILPLFDSGEADSFLFFVMPYVEGESLRDRLDREKQLPVEEAARIATEVADALAHAHGRGVIHRDIKPANILLRDGRVQVADFGIALAVQQAGGARLTETGLSLGTPHYMSPEQATGDRPLDGRNDVYSLGCVLYEMLAGEPPHVGPTAQSILSKILTEEPRPLRELRVAVSPGLEAVITRSLAKLPADRYASAEAFATELSSPPQIGSTGTPAGGRRRVAALAIGAMGLWVTGLLLGGWLGGDRSGKAAPVEHRQVTFDGSASYPALSPDGDWLAYQVSRCPDEDPCFSEIMVAELDGGEPISIGLTQLDGDREVRPLWFWDVEWSPDGSRVLVAAGFDDPRFNGLYEIPRLGGGATRRASGTVTSASYRPGTEIIDWIFFPEALQTTTAPPRWRSLDLVTQDTATADLPFPASELRWSPDGRWLAVAAGSSAMFGASARRVGIFSPSGELRDSLTVPAPNTWPRARWDQNGEHLFLGSRGSLVKVRVDGSTGMFLSDLEGVEEGLEPPGWDLLNFDRLPDGLTAYERYELRTKLRDLSGSQLGGFEGRWLETGTGRQDHPDLSPSGETVTLVKQDSRGLNLYVQPLSGGKPRPVTRTPAEKRHPRWSPNESQIAFVQTDPGGDRLVVVGRDGERPHEVGPISSSWAAAPFAWAPDGGSLYYVDRGEVWRAEVSGEANPLLPVPEDITVAWGIEISPGGDSIALLAHSAEGGADIPTRVFTASLGDLTAGWDLRFESDWNSFLIEGVEASGFVFIDWVHFTLLPWQTPGSLDVVVSRQTQGRDIVAIWKISLESGTATLAEDLSEHCSGGLSEVTATVDLSRIICTVRDVTRDIWLLDPSGEGSSR